MIEIRPAGDTGWLVSLGRAARPDAVTVRRVRRLKGRVDRAALPGVIETHVGYRSLLVSYDPVAVNPGIVRDGLDRIAAEEAADADPAQGSGGRVKRFALCTCPACATDRDSISRLTGLGWDEVVRRYCAVTFEVWVMGFQPGCPFLGPVPGELNLPRLDAPRVRVPAGSVGIGGWQTGIYASPSPSGWRLLGRTPAVLFDPRRNPPNRLAVGDRVVFEPSADHVGLHGGATLFRKEVSR
ncbi:MAG: allophanate hydrolase subunit 1 [Candidatus Coatesbacteria bacterium]